MVLVADPSPHPYHRTMTPSSSNRDRILPSRRREHGIVHAASVINWWLAKSEMSSDQLHCVSSWALGEKSRLISSNISHLRNARVDRPNLATIEALGCTNQAIWRWHVKGEAACLHQYGPMSAWKVRPEYLTRAAWLPDPDDDANPLLFEGWARLFAGMITLPYVGIALSPTENLSPALAALLNQQIEGAGPMGETMLRLAYPVQDPDRVALLLEVVAGRRDYTRDELEEELGSLSVTIGKLRGLPEGSYTPEDLRNELSSGRRRSG